MTFELVGSYLIQVCGVGSIDDAGVGKIKISVLRIGIIGRVYLGSSPCSRCARWFPDYEFYGSGVIQMLISGLGKDFYRVAFVKCFCHIFATSSIFESICPVETRTLSIFLFGCRRLLIFALIRK
jgi:hypothetical protein